MDELWETYSEDPEVQQSMAHLVVVTEIAEQVRTEFLRYFNQLESLIMAIMLRAK